MASSSSANSDPLPSAAGPAVSPPSADDVATQQVAPADEDHTRKCLDDAAELKEEGNAHFKAQRWAEALVAYKSGLGYLPKRREAIQVKREHNAKGKGREIDPSSDEEPADVPDGGDDDDSVERRQEAVETQAPLERECAKARSVFNANIGACYVKLGDHKEAVRACTQALLDDPAYIKALQRRATSNEAINSWSSLGSAQEDYNALLKLLPSASQLASEVSRSLQSLKPRLEAAQKRETGEMVDKLKGLGNSILGNFGLSTDNFQFVPNGQGGYSMNFVR